MSSQKINLKKLTIKQKDEIQEFNNKFKPYSDFNFVSLISWDINNQAEYAIVNGNLVIKIPDYYSDDLIVSVLGDNLIDETLSLLLEKEKQLKLVPETVIKNIIDKQKFKITEEQHNHDYIYSLDKLSNLPGRDYRSKRKLRNRFLKAHGAGLRIEENFDPKKYKKQLDNLLNNWNKEKTVKHELASEKLAITRLTEMSQYLSVVWTGLFAKDELIGFSVNETLTNKYANCHFQKTLLSYKNSDIYLTTEVSKFLKEKGYQYINWEQDMGAVGLRQSKSSYKPELHLKKYSISRR